MSFAAEVRHWATPEDLAAYLAGRMPPPWAVGATLHHTVLPLPSQWTGLGSMRNLVSYYRDTKKWPAGPNLFICVGAKHPEDDGIWQLTPLDTVGVHAGECNSERWGIEVVGRYDATPWPPALRDVVLGTVTALLHWRGLDARSVNGHRDCHSPKTCPGSAINLDSVRLDIAARLGTSPPTMLRYTTGSPLLGQPLATYDQALAYLRKRGPWGEYKDEDLITILLAYWRMSLSVGIDPVLAIAQMIHETGGLTSWWSQRPRRNPAGLGVTGRNQSKEPANPSTWAYRESMRTWYEGLSFAAWDTASVPAHRRRRRTPPRRCR